MSATRLGDPGLPLRFLLHQWRLHDACECVLLLRLALVGPLVACALYRHTQHVPYRGMAGSFHPGGNLWGLGLTQEPT